MPLETYAGLALPGKTQVATKPKNTTSKFSFSLFLYLAVLETFAKITPRKDYLDEGGVLNSSGIFSEYFPTSEGVNLAAKLTVLRLSGYAMNVGYASAQKFLK